MSRQPILNLLLCTVLAAAPFGLQAQPSADGALARALTDHQWTLQSAADSAGKPIDGLIVPGHAFVLHFEGPRLGVQGGCNTMTGGWSLNAQNQLRVSRLAGTMKACEATLVDADRTLAALLAQPLDARFEPGSTPTLRLVSPERQTLTLVGKRTPASLYGKPTRMFLEVAPQTVDCVSGAGRTQCLRVRERHFDAKGLRIDPPGEWRDFHGGIEGYTHTPGVRNVLRINRYTRTQPIPADASRYVYVLDLVVESETVSK